MCSAATDRSTSKRRQKGYQHGRHRDPSRSLAVGKFNGISTYEMLAHTRVRERVVACSDECAWAAVADHPSSDGVLVRYSGVSESDGPASARLPVLLLFARGTEGACACSACGW
jgi:hypothetical protein